MSGQKRKYQPPQLKSEKITLNYFYQIGGKALNFEEDLLAVTCCRWAGCSGCNSCSGSPTCAD